MNFFITGVSSVTAADVLQPGKVIDGRSVSKSR